MASAENFKLLSNLDEICGMPVVTFLKKYPYLLLQDINNIKQLLVSFKRYNISNEQIKKHIKIFKMDNIVFLKRIKRLKRHSDLHMWLKSPLLLEMITHLDIVMNRTAFLHATGCMKWAHPHILLHKKSDLEK